MRALHLAALAAVLAGGPVLAQPAAIPDSGSVDTGSHTRRSPGPPVDRGPYTPQANQAYQGGGMVLQGAPGAPAPKPETTPPGQTPRNMVQPQ